MAPSPDIIGVKMRAVVLLHCARLCGIQRVDGESLPRRPPEMDVPPPGKAVLSMSGLSHSVIRVDTEEKLSVLTVQDVGQVMPGGIAPSTFSPFHRYVITYHRT